MNEKAFEVFISMVLLFSGPLVLAFRNRRNIFIGFRVGYTYHSERVWKKVNTFAGFFSIAYSILLLGLALHGIPLGVFTVIMVVFILAEVFIGIWMAKREYELEELSAEAPEKPPSREQDTKGSIRPYILLQLGFMAAYLILVALLWERLPERIATHFNASGEPDSYSSRFWGTIGLPVLAWLLPLALTLPAMDEGFFAKVSLYPPALRAWCLFTTLLSGGLLLVFTLVLLYNAGLVSSDAITYGAIAFLGALVFAIYRLLTVGKDGRV